MDGGSLEDAFDAGYPRDAAAALLIELDGLEAGLDEEAERVVAACRESGAREIRLARTEGERQLLWKGRKAAFGAFGRVAPAYMVMDGVIPRTRLPEILRSVGEPGALADAATAWSDASPDHKLTVLEATEVGTRVELVLAWARSYLAELQVSEEIRTDVAEGLEKRYIRAFPIEFVPLGALPRSPITGKVKRLDDKRIRVMRDE